MDPFKDILPSINSTKINIMEGVSDDEENKYPAFLITRAYSFYIDTIFASNEMNKNSHLPNRMQYDYMFYSLKTGKRFSKWFKPEANELIEMIKKAYGYSTERALEVVGFFGPDEIEKLRDQLCLGGSDTEKPKKVKKAKAK